MMEFAKSPMFYVAISKPLAILGCANLKRLKFSSDYALSGEQDAK